MNGLYLAAQEVTCFLDTKAWRYAVIDGKSARQGSGIDWDLVFRELAPLAEAKEAPEILSRLKKRAGQ